MALTDLRFCSGLACQHLGLEHGQRLWFLENWNGTVFLAPLRGELPLLPHQPLFHIPQRLGASHTCLSHWETGLWEHSGGSPLLLPLPSFRAPLGGNRLLLFGCPSFLAGLLPMGS